MWHQVRLERNTTSGRIDVFLAVENLFDESYAYRPGYPMPGSSAQVGVTVRGGAR